MYKTSVGQRFWDELNRLHGAEEAKSSFNFEGLWIQDIVRKNA